jgi:hypothetical protein
VLGLRNESVYKAGNSNVTAVPLDHVYANPWILEKRRIAAVFEGRFLILCPPGDERIALEMLDSIKTRARRGGRA